MNMEINKIALVTGGGTGIGKAIALQLAKNGAKVAIASRDRTHIESAAAEFTSLGLAAMAVQMDVSKKHDVARVVDEIVSRWGAIHILVNNAGRSGLSLIDDPDDTKWYDIINTNLHGLYLITKDVLKHMPDHSGGRVINISSVLGEVWRPRLHRLLHDQTRHDRIQPSTGARGCRPRHHGKHDLPWLGRN